MSIFKLLVNHQKKNSLVNGFRKKRFAKLQDDLFSLIQKKQTAQGSPFQMLDLGGDLNYWNQLQWDQPHCHITLLNLFDMSIPNNQSLQISAVKGNAIDTHFKDKQFDLVYSNSVIEHVGSYQNQQQFASEVNRLSDKYIIQTPSLWFPLEPHSLIPFFQFIPHPIRAVLIMIFNINYFPKAATYAEGLRVSKTTLMFTKKRFQQLFPDAHIQVEKLMGIPKSYTAIKL